MGSILLKERQKLTISNIGLIMQRSVNSLQQMEAQKCLKPKPTLQPWPNG
jgi:hypothetical protein